MCCSYTYLNLDTAVNFEGKLQQLASCCITDSESLHCCCRLPNTFASCWTFSMPLCHTIDQEMPPLKKLPLSLGEIWAPTPYMVLWSHLSPYLKRHLDPYPNGWTDQGVFGLWTVNGPRNHVLGRGPYILWEGQFWGVILGHAQTCVWSIFSTLFTWGKRALAYGYHSTIATCCS